MKVPIWLALAASPGWAHMKSMSSGDLTVDGARAGDFRPFVRPRDPALPPPPALTVAYLAAEIIAAALFAPVFPGVKRFARALHSVEFSASALLAFGISLCLLRLRDVA